MPLPEAVSNRLIGALFVERGLVSQSQLLVALELQQETGQQLGQILVERFGVPRGELAKVVAEHWARMGEAEDKANTRASESWRQLGEILVERGFVTREQLTQALDRQRQTGERLGEALVGQGVLTKFELAGSLAEQASTVGNAATAADGEPAPVVPLVRSEKPDEVAAEAQGESEPRETGEEDVEPTEEQAQEAPAAPTRIVTVVPPPAETEPEEPQRVEPEVEPSEPEPSEADEPDLQPAAVAVVPEQPVDPPADEAREETTEEVAAVACVALAPTPRGYRLVVLEELALPEPGDHVELPELGELVVLRRGVSPLPHDDRPCVFLEPPVPAA
jgi:hypothetical protein